MNRKVGPAIVFMVLLLAFFRIVTYLIAPTQENPCKIPNHLWGDPNLQQKWDKTLNYCVLITDVAENNGLDPTLLATVVFYESGGDPEAVSFQGAVGLMQVMPRDGDASSFMCNGVPCFSDRPTIQELMDPVFNINYGARYLAGLRKIYGDDIKMALFSYGPSGITPADYAEPIIKTAETIRLGM